ncbi:MAG: hypothetical protein IJD84_01430 [Parabacteroides sp.]|nr:hypothetical protein [Parabacteroides sp.]
MAFTLSGEMRDKIQNTTGLSHFDQQNIPVVELSDCEMEKHRKLYACKKSRVIPPRGSVYLQMGRILSLTKVKKFLSKI